MTRYKIAPENNIPFLGEFMSMVCRYSCLGDLRKKAMFVSSNNQRLAQLRVCSSEPLDLELIVYDASNSVQSIIDRKEMDGLGRKHGSEITLE